MVERAEGVPPQQRRGGRACGSGPPWAGRRASEPAPATGRADAQTLASTGHLRASDDERAAVTDALTRHHLAGRLDIDEYSERLEVAYGAKTRGELAPVLADLPADPPPRPPRRSHPRDLWFIALVAFAALMIITVVAGRPFISGGWWILAALWIWWRTGSPARRHRPTA
jgi:hypothetical protein